MISTSWLQPSASTSYRPMLGLWLSLCVGFSTGLAVTELEKSKHAKMGFEVVGGVAEFGALCQGPVF